MPDIEGLEVGIDNGVSSEAKHTLKILSSSPIPGSGNHEGCPGTGQINELFNVILKSMESASSSASSKSSSYSTSSMSFCHVKGMKLKNGHSTSKGVQGTVDVI